MGKIQKGRSQQMKVVLINNDLRVYWKGRLLYLRRFLAGKAIELQAVELFGKGSPYAFDSYNDQNDWWNCLFPDKSAGDLSPKAIEDAIFTALDKINPDLVIAPSIVFYAGALSIRWAKRNKKKFIMFDDAKPAQVKRNFLVQWVKNKITQQVDGFWLPSAEYKKEYAHFLKNGVHLFYGYNSINNDHFKFTVERRFDNNVILCVARLVPKKNLERLLMAWETVKQQHSTYKLRIIGTGPEQGKLTGLVENLNLKDVDFLGSIANNAIAGFFHNADAFILPSLSEEWGLVVNEAMAAGLPVLLSNRINAAQSFLKDGINGFSFDPYHTDDIAAAILKFINSNELEKAKMSARSLQSVDAMSYENMGLKLIAALTKIKAQTFKTPGALASILINNWSGRYDTTGWDKVQ